MSENIQKNRIQNKEIHLKIRVTPIDEKMRESHLRWFGHVQRSAINAPIRKSELILVEGTKRGKGRPKIILVEIKKKKKRTCQLTK